MDRDSKCHRLAQNADRYRWGSSKFRRLRRRYWRIMAAIYRSQLLNEKARDAEWMARAFDRSL